MIRYPCRFAPVVSAIATNPFGRRGYLPNTAQADLSRKTHGTTEFSSPGQREMPPAFTEGIVGGSGVSDRRTANSSTPGLPA
jgi:hypothetical protein